MPALGRGSGRKQAPKEQAGSAIDAKRRRGASAIMAPMLTRPEATTMDVQEIAREFDAAAAEFAALLDAGDDFRGIMEGLDRAAATQQISIATMTKTRAGSPEELMIKLTMFGRIEARQLWPGLAQALLGSIGRDAAELARAAN